jgi:Transmembrane proteins 14C
LGVDEVPVVGDRDLPDDACTEDGLGVAQDARAGSRVPRVPDRHFPGQAGQDLLVVENLVDQAHVLVHADGVPVAYGDPGRLLPAVLEGEQGEVRQTPGFRVWRVEAKHPTLFLRPIRVPRVGVVHGAIILAAAVLGPNGARWYARSVLYRVVIALYGLINIAGGVFAFLLPSARSVWSLVVGGAAGLLLLYFAAVADKKPGMAFRSAAGVAFLLACFWVFRITQVVSAGKSVRMPAGNLVLAILVVVILGGGHMLAIKKRGSNAPNAPTD